MTEDRGAAGLVQSLAAFLTSEGITGFAVSESGHQLAIAHSAAGSSWEMVFDDTVPGVLTAVIVLPGDPLPPGTDYRAALEALSVALPIPPVFGEAEYAVLDEHLVAVMRMPMPLTFSVANVNDSVALANYLVEQASVMLGGA
jgi:hypothetical protein